MAHRVISVRCGNSSLRGHSGRRSSRSMCKCPEHRRRASAQASRDDVAAATMPLAPCVGIAAALRCRPSAVAIERVRPSHGVRSFGFDSIAFMIAAIRDLAVLGGLAFARDHGPVAAVLGAAAESGYEGGYPGPPCQGPASRLIALCRVARSQCSQWKPVYS